ncbi:MAG: exodeoxyribonuclease VII small subunit [Sphingomonadales bacterium]|jgi:exodeoxyribonuclease VII small subunit
MTDKSNDKIPDEIAALSFEEALARLEAIVQQLETGDAALEKSIDIYKEGTYLKRHCQAKLAAAQAQVEKIRLSADGTPETQAFDVD